MILYKPAQDMVAALPDRRSEIDVDDLRIEGLRLHHEVGQRAGDFLAAAIGFHLQVDRLLDQFAAVFAHPASDRPALERDGPALLRGLVDIAQVQLGKARPGHGQGPVKADECAIHKAPFGKSRATARRQAA